MSHWLQTARTSRPPQQRWIPNHPTAPFSATVVAAAAADVAAGVAAPFVSAHSTAAVDVVAGAVAAGDVAVGYGGGKVVFAETDGSGSGSGSDSRWDSLLRVQERSREVDISLYCCCSWRRLKNPKTQT